MLYIKYLSFLDPQQGPELVEMTTHVHTKGLAHVLMMNVDYGLVTR